MRRAHFVRIAEVKVIFSAVGAVSAPAITHLYPPHRHRTDPGMDRAHQPGAPVGEPFVPHRRQKHLGLRLHCMRQKTAGLYRNTDVIGSSTHLLGMLEWQDGAISTTTP
ncbi:hypothetical protein ATO13_21246 [Stappia sp. 22II-S9-Z10]|nr:hypothetical protein ATO13_21246 [Stappia sp. 22II-S9-Z10]